MDISSKNRQQGMDRRSRAVSDLQPMTHAPIESTPPPVVALTARSLEIAETAGRLLTFLAPARFPAGPVLSDARGSTNWVVVDARLDSRITGETVVIPAGDGRLSPSEEMHAHSGAFHHDVVHQRCATSIVLTPAHIPPHTKRGG